MGRRGPSDDGRASQFLIERKAAVSARSPMAGIHPAATEVNELLALETKSYSRSPMASRASSRCQNQRTCTTLPSPKANTAVIAVSISTPPVWRP